MSSRDQLKRAASLTEEDFVQLGRCLLQAARQRRDADAEKNIREGLPLVPLRLVDGCDPVKSRAAGGGPRPLPHAAHR